MNKKLLVIVPYRDRESHLKEFIPYITNTLRSQRIETKIVIVEQNEGKLFNRGLLCNIGFHLYNNWCDYVVFHDVDMICDIIDYSYSSKPTSLLRHRTKKNTIYDGYFGGITLFPKNDFLKINGFSNEYWGWGAEDDDLRYRCYLYGLSVLTRDGWCEDLELTTNDENRAKNPHYQSNLSKLQNLRNKKDKSLIDQDGLSNVDTYFKIISQSQHSSHTLVSVKV